MASQIGTAVAKPNIEGRNHGRINKLIHQYHINSVSTRKWKQCNSSFSLSQTKWRSAFPSVKQNEEMRKK